MTWQLTDPLTQPEVEVMPFLLDWQDSIHPSQHLDLQSSLVSIELYHPAPIRLQENLEQLGVNVGIRRQEQAQINVVLQTPKGLVTI